MSINAAPRQTSRLRAAYPPEKTSSDRPVTASTEARSRLLLACTLGLLLAACGSDSNQDQADSPIVNAPLPADPATDDPVIPACPAIGTLDEQLRCLTAAADVTPLENAPVVGDTLFNAGRALFEGATGVLLSGPRTVSCASCHPTNNAGVETTLALHASLGTSPTIHRNAPDLVNKLPGSRRALFWDGRVWTDEAGRYHTPVGDQLPPGLDSLLATQALFPLLSRDEMLGYPDDGTDSNELAELAATINPETNPWPVWNGIVTRVKAHATVGPLLQAAYPDLAFADLGIQHIANALAAFQTRRWNPPTLAPAHFHAWLLGTGDLTSQAKRGGILFFGKAGCAACHNGPLLSDGEYHNLAVPQIGPGFASGAGATPPRDQGRYDVSGDETDLYAFLTPSLWEVKVTPPYMHNGVYSTLEQAVRHHLDATTTAYGFRCDDTGAVPAGVACHDSQTNAGLYTDMVYRLAEAMRAPASLTDAEISDLLAFLNQLTNGAN